MKKNNETDKQLPKDVEALLTDIYTLIGESLVDNEVEDINKFTKAQNNIAQLLKDYKVKNFEWVKLAEG